MIDWVTILLALVIITALVAGFGFVAWKINMSDPLTAGNLNGKKDETNSIFDVNNDKKRKDKNANEQKKKKRTVQKKSKRENKEDDDAQHVKFKEPSTQTSEETDNEREESEQESTAIIPQVVETSSKARKRKNKARSGTPPLSTGPVEGILVNKDEKSPVTDRPQPISHPKLVSGIPKDEVELAKLHHQHTKTQVKPSQSSNKQPVQAPVATVKKQIAPSTQTNVNQDVQKQQEQPFTTVVGKGHKVPSQSTQQQQSQPSQQQHQQQQQQQTKSGAALSSTVPSVTPPTAQQQAPVQVQHEQLAQRQPVRQQKETSAQPNGYNPNSLPAKQSTNASAPPAKIADLVKALPTSQVVVTELMSALDAFPLSTDELNIIMQKIANKQSLIKQDWSKLQHGQRVDPQAHIGQILNESARASEEDLKTNAMKRIKELSDELNNDKRRINDLLKETNEKDMNIKLLRTQLSSLQHQHPQQQQFQTYEVEYRRLADENMQLKQHLAQQQQHFQQQQQHLSSLNLTNNNSDSMNVQARVVNDQIKKLSIDNGKLEKQLQSKEIAVQEIQKEKDNLLRTNQQLSQKVQEAQKQFQHNEEKILQELNENRTLHMNQLNEYKRRIEELEKQNDQLRRAEMTRTEPVNPPTLNNEERLKFEQEINQLTQENEQYKKKFDDIQSQHQSQQNQLQQEIEQLKINVQKEESLNKELAEKNSQIESLQRELEDVKARNDTTNSQLDERLRQEHDKQKQFLINLLEQDVRNQLPNDNPDFNQWLSSYQQLFASNNETSKRTLQEECNKLKQENDQLHKNMNDVENQLKEIEQTVQSKEEILLTELKNKDVILENIQHENDQLSGQVQQLRNEIERLQSTHNTTLQESQLLKQQLDERIVLNNNINHNSSSNADKLSELIKQSPLLPIENNTRIDQLHELIRSGKEALENQDSIAQQLDKHLNDMRRSGTGETLITNLDDSSPSNQEQTPSES